MGEKAVGWCNPQSFGDGVTLVLEEVIAETPEEFSATVPTILLLIPGMRGTPACRNRDSITSAQRF